MRYRFDGRLVRAERERQGLTRAELAVRIGCTENYVVQVELNYAKTSRVDKAARFAAGLGRPIDDFVVPVDDDAVPA